MKLGAFAIIFDENRRVLISLRNDYDLWNLPGGGVEAGESPWEGVIREAKKETGLEVEIMRLSGVYYKPEKDELCLAFICKIVGGGLQLTAEAREHKYVLPDEIPRNFPPHERERVFDALGNDLVFKIQKGPSSIELLKQGKL